MQVAEAGASFVRLLWETSLHGAGGDPAFKASLECMRYNVLLLRCDAVHDAAALEVCL